MYNFIIVFKNLTTLYDQNRWDSSCVFLTLWIPSLIYVHILVIADNTKGFFDCPFSCPRCVWSFQTPYFVDIMPIICAHTCYCRQYKTNFWLPIFLSKMCLVVPDTLLCGYHPYYMCTYLLLQTIQKDFLTAHFAVQHVSGHSRHISILTVLTSRVSGHLTSLFFRVKKMDQKTKARRQRGLKKNNNHVHT